MCGGRSWLTLIGVTAGVRVFRFRFLWSVRGAGSVGASGRTVAELAVDLDPLDEDQAAFEAGAGLPLALAFLVQEGIHPEVADAKRDQDLAFSTDVFQVFTDQPVGFTTGDLAVEAGLIDVVRVTVQCGDVARHEGLAAADRDFANTVQVTNAAGVQVEVDGGGVIACSRHDGAPVQLKRGPPPALAAGEFRKGSAKTCRCRERSSPRGR